MPGFVEVWHLPLDSYIHFDSPTRATHYEYFLSIYPQPEKKAPEGGTISNMEARTSIVGWPGHYEDTLEKRNGEWRISSRRVAMEWVSEEMEESPLGPGGYKIENFAPTRYDASDPSYERDWS